MLKYHDDVIIQIKIKRTVVKTQLVGPCLIGWWLWNKKILSLGIQHEAPTEPSSEGRHSSDFLPLDSRTNFSGNLRPESLRRRPEHWRWAGPDGGVWKWSKKSFLFRFYFASVHSKTFLVIGDTKHALGRQVLGQRLEYLNLGSASTTYVLCYPLVLYTTGRMLRLQHFVPKTLHHHYFKWLSRSAVKIFCI